MPCTSSPIVFLLPKLHHMIQDLKWKRLWKQIKEPNTSTSSNNLWPVKATKQGFLLRDAALSFYWDQIAGCQVGLCHPHQQGLFQTKIWDTLLRSLFIFPLTYSTPHVYAIPRPSLLPLINFTNSSHLSSFHIHHKLQHSSNKIPYSLFSFNQQQQNSGSPLQFIVSLLFLFAIYTWAFVSSFTYTLSKENAKALYII